MIKVTFIQSSTVEDSKYKFAVICAKYKDKWVFCRHKQRTTWEIPGGHREAGEEIGETSRRELNEETGAIDFDITPLTPYCVEIDGEKTYGMLFFAEIKTLSVLSAQSEIGEIKLFDSLPDNLTYPMIQPYLFQYAYETENNHDKT